MQPLHSFYYVPVVPGCLFNFFSISNSPLPRDCTSSIQPLQLLQPLFVQSLDPNSGLGVKALGGCSHRAVPRKTRSRILPKLIRVYVIGKPQTSDKWADKLVNSQLAKFYAQENEESQNIKQHLMRRRGLSL